MDGIAQLIEKYRVKSGVNGKPISYTELGKRIGVSRAQAENFCKGRSIPSDKAMLRICEITGYSPAKMVVLEHHDRAPEQVQPVWREVLGRLKRRRAKGPELDSKLLKTVEGYKKLSHNGRASFVRFMEMYLTMTAAEQKHLLSTVKEWSESCEKLGQQLES